MTDIAHPDQKTGAPSTVEATPPASRQGGHQMDGPMMWAMMIGCCLAIPVALIIFGAGLGSLAGASPWLIGAAVVVAIALVLTRHGSSAPHRDSSSDRHE